jgi:hypothetical protein
MRTPTIRDPKLEKYRRHNPTAHGGVFHRTRWGRSRRRNISPTQTMNLTLRSTQARGPWSFLHPKNARAVNVLTRKFSARFAVRVLRLSNVGNHLHYHVLFPEKKAYIKFIRALTAALAVAITGCTRWTQKLKKKFWDLRPFTRILHTTREIDAYDSYLDLNDLEAEGFPRKAARWLLKMRQLYRGVNPCRAILQPSRRR